MSPNTELNVGVFRWTRCIRMCSWLTHGSGHWQVTNVLDLKLLNLLSYRLQKLHWNNSKQWIKQNSEQQVMSENRTGESPCLGKSSGEILSIVREREGLISDFSDIIYRQRKCKLDLSTGAVYQPQTNKSSCRDLKLKGVSWEWVSFIFSVNK